MWLKLSHVCGRWRYITYNSPGLLDLYFLLTNNSPSLDTLSHLPPLPLVIDYSDKTGTVTMARKDDHNVHLALQQHGRVRRVTLRAPALNLRMWLKPMNKLFPRLGDLSVLSTTIEEMNLVLPETFQAPDLRRLSLHGIGLSRGLSLLSCVIALSTLSLTHIGASCYFPPGHLVTQLQSLPHLEELSIGFAIPIPLPSSEGELLPPPIPPVTLPSLRRFTFRGVDVYLESFVAQINTPRLERLSLTLLFDLAFTLVNLTEFIGRTEEFRCLVAKVIFNKDGPCINDEHQGIRKLSLRVNCKPLDWQMDSMTQVCSALAGVLSTVEELTLDLDVDGIPSDWENTLDNTVWHELLLPFVGVKKLRISSSLSLQLSQALEAVSGGLLALELLPELQELEIYPGIYSDSASLFSAFVEIRESVGLPVHIRRTYKLPGISEPRPRRLGPQIRSQRSRMRSMMERSRSRSRSISTVSMSGSNFSSRSSSICRITASAATSHGDRPQIHRSISADGPVMRAPYRQYPNRHSSTFWLL